MPMAAVLRANRGRNLRELCLADANDGGQLDPHYPIPLRPQKF